MNLLYFIPLSLFLTSFIMSFSKKYRFTNWYLIPSGLGIITFLALLVMNGNIVRAVVFLIVSGAFITLGFYEEEKFKKLQARLNEEEELENFVENNPELNEEWRVLMEEFYAWEDKRRALEQKTAKMFAESKKDET